MAEVYESSGKPFNKLTYENIKDQIKRVEDKFPSLIIIDGGQGQGKTTLAIEILDCINEERGISEVSLNLTDSPQVAIGGKEFIKKFNLCKDLNLPGIIYDEGGDFAKRGAMGRFNAMLNRRFETFRSSSIIVIIVLPNFNILDNNLFDLRVPRILFHCRDREETITYGNAFLYSFYGMQWIRYWFDKLPKAIRYQCYTKVVPNVMTHFKNLSQERANKLEKLSDRGKDDQSAMAEIKLEGYVNFDTIAQKVNRSVTYVRDMIRKLKIEHKKKYKNMKFFHESVVERLLDYVDSRKGRRKD